MLSFTLAVYNMTSYLNTIYKILPMLCKQLQQHIHVIVNLQPTFSRHHSADDRANCAQGLRYQGLKTHYVRHLYAIEIAFYLQERKKERRNIRMGMQVKMKII